MAHLDCTHPDHFLRTCNLQIHVAGLTSNPHNHHRFVSFAHLEQDSQWQFLHVNFYHIHQPDSLGN